MFLWHMRPERVSIASRHRKSDRITGALRSPPQSQPRARRIAYPSQTIGYVHLLRRPAPLQCWRQPGRGTATINRRRQICAVPGSASGHRCGVCSTVCASAEHTALDDGYLSFTSKFVHLEPAFTILVSPGERLAWMEKRVISKLLLTLADELRTRTKAG